MRAERAEPAKQYVPIILTLETLEEAVTLKAIACCRARVAEVLEEDSRFRGRISEVQDVLTDLFDVLGFQNVDATGRTA